MDRSDHSSAISGFNTQRMFKLATAVCFLLLAYALFAMKLPEAPGYEISIYTAVSKVVWVAVISSIFIGLCVILYHAFQHNNSNFWLIGFLLLGFALYIFFIIPHLWGYYNADYGDPLIHIGWMNTQLEKKVLTDNPYPFTHLFFMQLHLISGAPLRNLIDYTIPFISILGMIITYLLGRLVIQRHTLTLIIAALTVVPLLGKYHVVLFPNSIALQFLPILMYFYFLGDRFPVQGRICLIFWLLIYPFLYAPVALVVVISFIGLEIARAYLRRTGPLLTEAQTERFTYNPALISFIALFIWSSSFPAFNSGVQNAYGWILGETVANPQIPMVEGLTRQLGVGQTILLILKTYGVNLIYGALAAIGGLLLILRIKHLEIWSKKMLLICSAFVFAIPLGFIIYATMLCAALGRIVGLNYSMWATPLLAGFAIFLVYQSFFRKRVKVFIISLAVMLTMLSTLSLFTIWRSPFTNQPNYGTTFYDIEGTEWFLKHAQDNYVLTSLGFRFPFPEYLVASWLPSVPKGVDVFKWRPYYMRWPFEVPIHFGYDVKDRFGDWYGVDNYFIISKRFRMVSPILQKESNFFSVPEFVVIGFEEVDFRRFDSSDPSVSKLYSNSEYWVYSIKGGTATYNIPEKK